VGKHPAVAWGEISYGDAVPRPTHGAGVGIKTGAHPKGSGVFVVDLDGEEAAAHWLALGGEDEGAETLTVQTPRGWHLYFEHPGFPVKNSAGDLGKGIDVRGDGGFVVAPGSPHRSGGVYGEPEGALRPAPAWLLEWLRARPTSAEVQHYPGDVSGAERHHRRGLYAEYLRTAAPCVGGAGGDGQLFKIVQHGAYDLALPVDDVLELVRDVYDPRCEPPWGDELEERVTHKAHDAKASSARPRFEPLPADLTHLAQRASTASFVPPKPAACAGSLGEKWGGWDVRLPPPIYLLEGLIPEHKVVTFFAEGGSVKTWSALSLAISVAEGKPWLDQYAVKKGRVLYLDYEDGPHEMNRRVWMLTGGSGVPDLGYLYGGQNIDKIDLWKALAKKVIEEGITLVVIDSLGASMPGDADENDTAFAEGMKIAGKFTEVGCTVLFVHHANKQGGMRGTSAARDASDVVFKFEPVSETDSIKRMRMVCDKPGPQKRPAPVNVQLSDAGLTTFKDEAADMGRNAAGERDVKAAVLLALRDGPMVAKAILKRVGGRETSGTSAIKELEQEGRIVTLGKFLGWQLDDDGKRRARLLSTAPSCRGTITDLAKRARVPRECVEGAVDDGSIALRTGMDGGGFVVVDRTPPAGATT
jgi:hypothetical protein